MTRTHAHAAAAPGRRATPEPRHAVPVFRDEGRPIVLADADAGARPELEPAADAFGRAVGYLLAEPGEGAGDARPTHAPRSAFLDAELDPAGIYRTADGRMFAHFRLASLAGAKVDAPAGVYLELNPAAPVGAVWDALWRPAFPECGEG